MNRFRVKYNGFPNALQNSEDRSLFLDNVNKKLSFPLHYLESNKTFRNVWKSAMVAFLGKFGEKQIRKNTKFLSDLDDFEEHVFAPTENGKKVVLSHVTEDLCQVSIFKKPTGKRRNGNVLYTALINAMARDKLYFDLLKIQDANCKVLYIDTDAVIFSSSKQRM